ncbi:Outer membrane protein beta-barrel domain-containing protein [Chitinophaga costaii]|uniref:Outer membrane protein beta-barrel domain-containing protein n=1 Tax=Chitinophaga costaii TaxID=1335309 RepID=A0A1C3Z4V3_9BACT|nr:porin family protein [Chitinophaga costaii]PUZ30231.1 PorT family protein [Chitinophaga costaii]SCB77355.1 Outer membrane protein beta-barrel domain-containing protein [Chitinophaga costaii]
MKKLVFAIVLLVFSSVSIVKGQTGFFKWGFKVGANLGKLDGTGYNNAFKLGYHLGGFAQVNFIKGFGVQGELIFSQSTTRTVDNFREVYNGENLQSDADGKKINLNYLSIPIMVNIPLGTPRIKLQVGPQYSILVSGRNVIKASGDAFKTGDFGVVGGLWFQLPIINISARYVVGLSDMNNFSEAADQSKWRNQAIQLGVGITL